jgi:hypothetical protein
LFVSFFLYLFALSSLLSFLVSLSLPMEILEWSRFNEVSVVLFHSLSYSSFVIISDVAHVENHENIPKINILVFTLRYKLAISRIWSRRTTYIINNILSLQGPFSLISKPNAVPRRTHTLQQMKLAHGEVAERQDADVVFTNVCTENVVLWNYFFYFCV